MQSESLPSLRILAFLEEVKDVFRLDLVAFSNSMIRLLLTECFISGISFSQIPEYNRIEVEAGKTLHVSHLYVFSRWQLCVNGASTAYNIEPLHASWKDLQHIMIILGLQHVETVRKAEVAHDIESQVVSPT